MDWRTQTIQTVYGGDEQLYEQAYEEAVNEAIQEAVSWQDLALGATVLTDWEKATHAMIERYLGYLPHSAVRLRYEPYLRALLQQHHQGYLSDDALTRDAVAHIKLVRNADMVPYSSSLPAAHFQQMYQEQFGIYGLRAKERLSRFLGYVPQIEHSMMAELWLWDVMAHSTIDLPQTLTAVDYKALTITRYREILFAQGIEVADASSLNGPCIPSQEHR